MLVLSLGCRPPEAPVGALVESPAVAAEDAARKAAADPAGPENLIHVSDRIVSGGEPQGEAAFESLVRMGIRTVVSVDGARPDVEAARRHGLRYVHIPIGYDGVSETAGAKLTRLVRECEGPIYIHCHHGKHRGPAAAAIACLADGALDHPAALKFLERAGTSRDYHGLWRDVEAWTPPAPHAELPELVETAAVDSLTAAMADLDRSFDRLVLCRDAGWAVPAGHPDVVPAREALLLREGFHESLRNLSDDYGEEFRDWLDKAEALAAALERALADNDAAEASRRFRLVEESCRRCHDRYR